MSGKKLSDDQIRARLDALENSKNEDGTYNIMRAARAAGVSRVSMQHFVEMKDAGKYDKKAMVEFPPFVMADESEPIDKLLTRLVEGYGRHRKAAVARDWFTIKIKETRPYGLLAFGDQHLGDPGCNMPLLMRHLEVAKQEGVHAINLGDVNNRWVGRLVRKYMEQETTRSQEERLAEWLLSETGANWIVWILGNHDLWDGGAGFFKRLCKGIVPMLEWKAQFEIAHRSGSKVRLDCSHGRKGNSIWNETHGTLRDAKLGDTADIYLTAHTHNFGIQRIEIPQRRMRSWLVQTRGYKEMDEYSRDHGFSEYTAGAAVLFIVDPRRDRDCVTHCFEDPEQGAEYLAFLRKP
jgi:hypothetical protein